MYIIHMQPIATILYMIATPQLHTYVHIADMNDVLEITSLDVPGSCTSTYNIMCISKGLFTL